MGRVVLKNLHRGENPAASGDHPAPTQARVAANGAWLYRDNARARLRAPRAHAHAHTHVPVPLVTPLKDPFLSERLCDDLDRWVPRLVRRTLRVGHWIPRTHTNQLATRITDFVEQTENDTEPAARPGEMSASCPQEASIHLWITRLDCGSNLGCKKSA